MLANPFYRPKTTKAAYDHVSFPQIFDTDLALVGQNFGAFQIADRFDGELTRLQRFRFVRIRTGGQDWALLQNSALKRDVPLPHQP